MKNLLSITILVFVLIWGCESERIMSTEEQISRIDISVTGLNALGDSAWYEAWLVWLNKTVTGDIEDVYKLGKLESDGNGQYLLSISANQGYFQGALSVVVSIESSDSIEVISDYKVIGADLVANTGEFTIGSNQILDFDFRVATGTYILDTPTENPPSQNPKSGIWFVGLDTTYIPVLDSLGNQIDEDTLIEMTQGLDLQDLESPGVVSGWIYEGWVIMEGDTLSTGKFTRPVGADMSPEYSRPAGEGYPFPGEDFLRNAPAGLTFPTDLSGAQTFITLSPNHPENANSPFTLIPFATTIPNDAREQTVYSLDNMSETVPGGGCQIEITIYK